LYLQAQQGNDATGCKKYTYVNQEVKAYLHMQEVNAYPKIQENKLPITMED
jgi:hypothetical protein